MSISSSQHLSLSWKENEANPTPRFLFFILFFIFIYFFLFFYFFCGAAPLSPCTLGQEQQGLSSSSSCLLSMLLHPPIACGWEH